MNFFALINGTRGIIGNFTVTGTGFFGSVIVSGDDTSTQDVQAAIFQIRGSTNSNKRLVFGFQTTADYGYIDCGTLGVNYKSLVIGREAATKPTLFGTVTDSNNGRIQLATHTTLAGGIGFGTDTNLFRSGVGVLSSTASSAALATGTIFNNTNSTGYTSYRALNDTGGLCDFGVGGSAATVAAFAGYGYISAGGGSNGFKLFTNAGTLAITVDNTQNAFFQNQLVVANSVALPAGGSTAGRLLITAGLIGIYAGSGAPTVSASKGSIYLRSDGSGVADRLYVNTNGTTGWTNFVSAT